MNNRPPKESMTHEALGDRRPATYEIATIFMIALLAISAIASIMTLWTKSADIKVDKTSLWEVIQGRFTAAYEKEYEQALVGRDIAVATWGAVRYGLTGTGNKGMIVGDNGWLFTAEEFEEHKRATEAEARKLKFIKNVKTYLDSFNIKLVVALIPAKARVYSDKTGGVALPEWRYELYDNFLSDLHKANIIAPRLLDKFIEGKEKTQLFMKTDTHWSPAGAAMVATQIDSSVHKSFPDLKLKNLSFLSLEQEPEPYDGDLSEFVPTGIFKPYIGVKSEPLAKHLTKKMEPKNEDSDLGGDLFGDEIIETVLVGTSYSFEKEWNFEWALKEAMLTDVLNVSEEGKGSLVPMVTWLKETDLSTNPPKLVIWEMPERFIPKYYDDVSLDFMETLISSQNK